MKKLTLAHSEAVSAAKASLLRMLERDAPPAWKALIEKQVELMSDIYWWVLKSIYEPGLPLVNGSFELKNTKPERPGDNGPETKPNRA